MLVVEGALIDADGCSEGYVVLDSQGRVRERGQRGALPPRHGPVLSGIVLPPSANGHTHLGDSVWRREPPLGNLADVVAPPRGLKHRVLAGASPSVKIASMQHELAHMLHLGTPTTLDFREEGRPGIEMLRSAARASAAQPVILGRPLDLADREELSQVLEAADGVGLSSLQDMDLEDARAIAKSVHRHRKLLGLHVSENRRERLDPILDLKPSFMVHATMATKADLERVADAGTPLVFCPRSNALYGRFPPLAEAYRLNIPSLLGTDNAMFNRPDLFREMEFAYLSARLRGEPLPPEALVRAVFITPWSLLGRPEMARLQIGGKGSAVVLRLPTEDPYYQVCTRAGPASLVKST